MRFKRSASATLIVAMLAGCSTASKDIVATNVSPMQYANYDCEQIRLEMIRVSNRVNEMTGKLDKNRENDNMVATAGAILFFPALFFLGGTKEQEAEYARLKGEYNALDQVSIQKKCIAGATTTAAAPADPNMVKAVAPATETTKPSGN
ncbi:hypothetical protein [Lacisediminimonas profundi]|uniref:hypothetical protein n=1 Tax=Lacisediminimonas profundi TaxID=2603856 RepID=UPI001883DCBB|nr:hypothetical protein [Lacisediminimonas profundi]